MKTTVINLEGIESVLSPAGVEKRMCSHPGIHKVETNFMTSTPHTQRGEPAVMAKRRPTRQQHKYMGAAGLNPAAFLCRKLLIEDDLTRHSACLESRQMTLTLARQME